MIKFNEIRRGRVLKEYRPACRVPLVLNKGEKLAVERKKTSWDGWLWCTTKNGRKGWVPEKYLERSGPQGKALRDYDASELTVGINESLEILDEESGWFWCRTERGNYGWIPKDHVEIEIQICAFKEE